MLSLKRKAAFVFVFILLFCIKTLASDVEVILDDSVTYNAQYIVLGGKTTAPNTEQVALIITEAGVELSQMDKIVLFDEQQVEEDGTFRFVFRLPDTGNAALKDYDAYVRVGKSQIQTITFSHFGENAKSAVVTQIKSAGSVDTVMQLLDDINNQQVLKQLGFDILWYNTFEDDKNQAWIASLLESEAFDNISTENLSDTLHGEIALYMFKNGINTDEALKHMNLGYDKLSEEESKYVVEVFKREKPGDFEEINEVYSFARILYSMCGGNIKNADDLITGNYKILGLDDSVFDIYEKKPIDQRYDLCEKILKVLSSNTVYTRRTFAELYEEKESQLSKSTESSGGGSGKSKTSSVAFSNNTDMYVPIVTKTAYYNDIADYPWANEAITALTDKKIISGDGSGNFYPEKLITREEFLKMLVLAGNFNIENTHFDFDDVLSTAWYYSYVSAGYANNIVKGISEKEFGVGLLVTRQDVAVMLKRAFERNKTDYEYKREYALFEDEADISDYAEKSVELLYRMGIINGYEDNTFRPENSCTRAEAVKMIYEAFLRTEG